FRINHSRTDRPAVNTPSTSSTSTSYAAPIRISPDLQMTTSYVVTRSSVGGSSSSRTTGTGYSLEYRPPGRPYHVIYSVQKNNSSTSSASGASSGTSSTRNQINAAYLPSKTWSHSASFQLETTRTGSTGSYKSNTLTYVTRYKPSNRKNYFLQLNQTKRAGFLTEKYTTYSFGLDYAISKILSWKLDWKRSGYNNTKDASQGFTGDLMETELRATF
ncbi:hypothetical protein KKG41_07165, partial [Patescibacteria group bacterium]|nr:hypothetical protein [Patescibacteria group bacterium]